MQTLTQTTGSTTIELTPNLFALIDHAGALDQEIKALTKQLDQLKTTIKTQDGGDYDGFVWSAKVVDVKATKKVDWESVAKRLNPSQQLITAHTTTTKATKRVSFDLIK